MHFKHSVLTVGQASRGAGCGLWRGGFPSSLDSKAMA